VTMIVDSSESHLVSSLGWIDKSKLWTYEVASGRESYITVGDADYLSLLPGRQDLFACVQQTTCRWPEISAHSISSPRGALARIIVEDDAGVFVGDTTVWQELPSAYLVQGPWDGRVSQRLLLVHAESREVEIQRMAWFDESYDHVYQSIIGVVQVPGSELVVFSVQRDSHPVLYAPQARTALRRISLAGRAGNPVLLFRQTAPELWATDYDTVVRLETSNWLLLDSQHVQPAVAGTAHFIGGLAFDRSERICAVARPASGDVIALDTDTFHVTHRAELGRQPIEVVALRDGRVFSRDWKTGRLLTGMLMPFIGS